MQDWLISGYNSSLNSFFVSLDGPVRHVVEREIIARWLSDWSHGNFLFEIGRVQNQCRQLALWKIDSSRTKFKSPTGGQYHSSAPKHPILNLGDLERWSSSEELAGGACNLTATWMWDSEGVFGALARCECSCLGLKEKRSGLKALTLKRSLMETRRGCDGHIQQVRSPTV